MAGVPTDAAAMVIGTVVPGVAGAAREHETILLAVGGEQGVLALSAVEDCGGGTPSCCR